MMDEDHQQDEDMMGNHQQDKEEVSTPVMMHQSKIVKEIMGKVVSQKSSMNYSPENVTFALFNYEKNEQLRDHLLESWFVERLATFGTLTKKRNMCKNVAWHAARRTITVFLYCPISHSHILVIFSPCEPGVEGKQRASQICWGFRRTIQKEHARSSLLDEQV